MVDLNLLYPLFKDNVIFKEIIYLKIVFKWFIFILLYPLFKANTFF